MHNGTWLNGHQYRKSVAVIEIEVAALKRCSKYGVLPLELELSDCSKEVAALHSDHYTYTGSTA